MAWVNLDYECQKLARELADKVAKQGEAEKLVESTTSVLSRQGPTAAVLFLESVAKKPVAKAMLEALPGVFALVEGGTSEGESRGKHAEDRVKCIANDLPQLLLLRKLLMQFYTYLRHYVRAAA
jgi:hypothetical protein